MLAKEMTVGQKYRFTPTFVGELDTVTPIDVFADDVDVHISGVWESSVTGERKEVGLSGLDPDEIVWVVD